VLLPAASSISAGSRIRRSARQHPSVRRLTSTIAGWAPTPAIDEQVMANFARLQSYARPLRVVVTFAAGFVRGITLGSVRTATAEHEFDLGPCLEPSTRCHRSRAHAPLAALPFLRSRSVNRPTTLNGAISTRRSGPPGLSSQQRSVVSVVPSRVSRFAPVITAGPGSGSRDRAARTRRGDLPRRERAHACSRCASCSRRLRRPAGAARGAPRVRPLTPLATLPGPGRARVGRGSRQRAHG